MNELSNKEESSSLSNKEIFQMLFCINPITMKDNLLVLLNSQKFKSLIQDNISYYKPRSGDIGPSIDSLVNKNLNKKYCRMGRTFVIDP